MDDFTVIILRQLAAAIGLAAAAGALGLCCLPARARQSQRERS